jgi:hypothetical protein
MSKQKQPSTKVSEIDDIFSKKPKKEESSSVTNLEKKNKKKKSKEGTTTSEEKARPTEPKVVLDPSQTTAIAEFAQPQRPIKKKKRKAEQVQGDDDDEEANFADSRGTSSKIQ